MQLLSCALLLLVSAAVCYTAQAANYTWVITAGQRSPDCVTKDVVLVNNEYMPTLDLTQGEEVEIKVTNALPANWPDVSNGISIHWHGFKMKTYNWYDGVAHVSQCPIKRGSSFTYRFKVNETPGTYFWHDHAGMNRADGLQGAMIVRPANGTKELYSYDDERTLFVMDLWHLNANAMGMRLNRPFDNDKATNATGAWYWVGLPKSVLINGKGHYNDCEDVYKRVNGSALPTGAIATAADLMTPPAKAGALGPTAAFPTCNVTSFANTESTGMCEHESIDVVPGKTYLFRVINAATQVYQTHCFEKHNVTVVAVDGNPVAPQTFSECVDVNSGQRLDVLLTTDQPADNYWITVTAQYRKGAPSGYAVLHYSSAPAMALPAAGSHPLLQPQDGDKKKWTPAVTLSLQAHPVLLNPITAADKTAAAPYLDGYESQSAPTNITRRFVLTTTQPLLEANGVLRWAVNNVVHAKNPSCGAMLSEVAADNDYAAKNAMKNDYDGVTGYFPVGSLEGDGKGVQVFDGSVRPEDELVKAKTPKAGTHVISLKAGEVVEVVLQNFRAGAFGGEYNETSAATFNRTGREQHPWHIHGYRMWLVGSGSGEWNESMVSTYNTKTPVLRDTVTLFADANLTITGAAGWTAFRFVADNPGVWPLHCHISWHQFMGQVVYFIVEPSEVNAPPKDLPVCDGVCRYNFASWTPALTNAAYPNNPLLAPPASGFATSNGRRLMRHTTA